MRRIGGGLFYGWVLVGTLSLTEMVSWGILYYTFTVMLLPMQQELGWSRAELSGAFSLALVLSGLGGLVVGNWLDRFGPRLLMTAGSIGATGLVLAWSTVNNLASYYLIWAGLGLVMSAVLYEPAFVVVTTWFKRRRGRALTLLTFVAGFASVIFLPLSDWLVRTQGWRGALVNLAVLLAIVTIPLHWLVLRRSPADLGLMVDGIAANAQLTEPNGPASNTAAETNFTLAEALRGGTFWWLTTAFALNIFAIIAISVHLVPYLAGRGFDSTFAAGVAGLIGIMALPGRLIFNLLAERLPRRGLTAFIFLLQTLALLCLLLIPSIVGVLTFVALFGAGFGAITPLRAGMLAEFYGLAYYGRITSVLNLFGTLARGLGPLGLGLAYDLHGNYEAALWSLTVVSALAAVAILLAGRPVSPTGSNRLPVES